MLSAKGKVIGDFTVAKLAEESFTLTGSFGVRAYHRRWFEQHLPDDGSVSLQDISIDRIGFQIAGPNARKLLERTTRADVSNQAFPFMSVREIEVGTSDAIVCRVTYTGDLGYEIYVPAEEQVSLYETLTAAGNDLGLRPFGIRAMMSLKLEKSFGSFLREFRADFLPAECGLDRFVAYNKPVDFIGKAAAMEEKARGPARRSATFVVDALDADVVADEPIWKNGAVVGFVTSGGYAHFQKKSVALGLIPTEMIEEGAAFEIEILGEKRAATLITQPLLDPRGERMRG